MNNKFVSAAALIGIYAALVFDIFSSTNSSPQTTELFAGERGETLWKWVRIGAIISLAFVAMAVFMERRDAKGNAWAPLIGGMLALGIMYWMYNNAIKSGGGKKEAAGNFASELPMLGVDW